MLVETRLARMALARAQIKLGEAYLELLPLGPAAAPLVTAAVAIESAEDSVRTALSALEKLGA